MEQQTRLPIPADRSTIDQEDSLRVVNWTRAGTTVEQHQCVFCLRQWRDKTDALHHVYIAHILGRKRPIGSPEEVEQIERNEAAKVETGRPANHDLPPTFPQTEGDPEGNGLSMTQLESEDD